MKEPTTVQEAIELLKQGQPLVVERSESGATYLEYMHGLYMLSEYDNEGNLTYWKALETYDTIKLLKEIIRQNNV